MRILQQPRSHIPQYEADYEALKHKHDEHMSAHRVSAFTHVPPAPRAAARVSQRHRVKLPVKPSAQIVHHAHRVKLHGLISVPPFDTRFPIFPVTKERVVLFSVVPFDSRFPIFASSAKRQRPVPPRPMLDSDEKNMEISSVNPFDANFPVGGFQRRGSPQHRRMRNRSAIKRRRLQAAVAQYRRERGPVAERPRFDPSDRKLHPVDPSVQSFSPWQEAEFAVYCKIPLPLFVAPKKLRAATKAAAEILKPQILKSKKPRYISYSPFNHLFPSFAASYSPKSGASPTMVLALATKMAPAANAFPAYSPLAAKQAPVPASAASFNLPSPSQAAAAVSQSKLPRPASLHMH